MAEMRDYKRRRQSYRAKNVHITKKSYTEVDELIKNNKCCPDSNHLLHLYIIHDEGEITFSLNYEGCCESQEPLFPSLVGNVKSNSTLKLWKRKTAQYKWPVDLVSLIWKSSYWSYYCALEFQHIVFMKLDTLFLNLYHLTSTKQQKNGLSDKLLSSSFPQKTLSLCSTISFSATSPYPTPIWTVSQKAQRQNRRLSWWTRGRRIQFRFYWARCWSSDCWLTAQISTIRVSVSHRQRIFGGSSIVLKDMLAYSVEQGKHLWEARQSLFYK